MKIRNIIFTLVLIPCLGLLEAKAEKLSQTKKNVKVAETKKSDLTAYLFLNAKDQDSGCSRIYSLFQSEMLPAGAKKVKVDIGSEDQSLFKKYNVLVLPTILIVDAKEMVQGRIEGEGSEVEEKIKTVFQKTFHTAGKK